MEDGLMICGVEFHVVPIVMSMYRITLRDSFGMWITGLHIITEVEMQGQRVFASRGSTGYAQVDYFLDSLTQRGLCDILKLSANLNRPKPDADTAN